jgi:hypothetical protein
VTPVGGFGIVDGVTATDAEEAIEVPIEFVAVTVNEYGAPLVNPFTTHVVAGATEVHVPATLLLESYAVTAYPVIVDPLLFAGAPQVTVADAFAATADTDSGADGAAFIAAAADAVDAAEVPAELIAITLNV